MLLFGVQGLDAAVIQARLGVLLFLADLTQPLLKTQQLVFLVPGAGEQIPVRHLVAAHHRMGSRAGGGRFSLVCSDGRLAEPVDRRIGF